MTEYEKYLEDYNAVNHREFLRRHPMKPTKDDLYDLLKKINYKCDEILRRVNVDLSVEDAEVKTMAKEVADAASHLPPPQTGEK